MQEINPKDHPRIWLGVVSICEEYQPELEISPTVELYGFELDLPLIEQSLADLSENQIKGMAVKQMDPGEYDEWLEKHPQYRAADALFDEIALWAS